MKRLPDPEEMAQPETNKSQATPKPTLTSSDLIREPLLHFLLVGIALFACWSYLHQADGDESPDRIRLTFEDMQHLDILFQSQWHRPPSPDEFNRLVEDRIQEEILYREGIAMGLDKEDTIVKRRMAQKLQFLAQDMAAAYEPTTTELKTWFEENRDKFAMPSRLNFRHLYFSPDTRGERAHGDAAEALAELEGQPQDVGEGDRFMLQDYYRDRAPEYLGKEFGPQFAQAVAKLEPGSWQGPVQSGFGWHLVFIDTVIPGSVPAFEEVEPDVKTAWLGEQKELAWRKAYAEMRAKYTVSLPALPDEGTEPVAASERPVSTTTNKGPSQ